MHLLYADESEGYLRNEKYPRYFILAGVSVFECHTFGLSKELDAIASRFNSEAPETVELHGSPMFNRRGFWETQPLQKRITAMRDSLHILANSHKSNRIFAVVVKQGGKENAPMKSAPMTYAFEQLAAHFDRYLERIRSQQNTRQHGMILFDKSAYETAVQTATSAYRNRGHPRVQIKHFAEVPVFIDSRASRLVQLADIVAYAVNRAFARGDPQFYDIIKSRFDSEDGKMHGLHIKSLREETMVKNRTIFTRDNLEVLRGMDSESVDLVYLDPPFNSNRTYAAPVGSRAAGAEFKDSWSMDDTKHEWHGLIADEHPALYKVIEGAGAAGGKGDKAYLIYMSMRLLELRRILKPSGSIYYHCDPVMSHGVKLVMDAVFGRNNFRNEIIWRIGWVSGYKTQKQGFIRNHDTLLYYVKSPVVYFLQGIYSLPPTVIRAATANRRRAKAFPLKTRGIATARTFWIPL